MTTTGLSDFGFFACHVVGKIPALGIAICLGAAADYTNVVPVDLLGNAPQVDNHCTEWNKAFLIDLENAPEYVSLGKCLEEYNKISLAELRERCARPEAKDEKICAQIL